MNTTQYIREILQRSCLPAAERRRLRGDLENEIAAALERGERPEQVMERMGDPDRVAAELYENYVRQAPRPFREYKSNRMLFGLPLVHIIRGYGMAQVPQARAAGLRFVNIGGRYGAADIGGLPTARGVFAFGPKARGVVAVGNFAAGFLAVGNFSAGIISIGNLSAGLFSVGNLSLALLFALGNAAAGALCAGNAAVGYAAAGNLAVGRYALGNDAAGTFTFIVSDLSAQFGQIRAFLAGLDAPAPVRLFFTAVEKALTLLNDPAAALPLLLAASALLLLILALFIVPNRLLKQDKP